MTKTITRKLGLFIVFLLNIGIVLLGGWRPTIFNRRLNWTKEVWYKSGASYVYLRTLKDAAKEQENLWRTRQ